MNDKSLLSIVHGRFTVVFSRSLHFPGYWKWYCNCSFTDGAMCSYLSRERLAQQWGKWHGRKR